MRVIMTAMLGNHQLVGNNKIGEDFFNIKFNLHAIFAWKINGEFIVGLKYNKYKWN